jgi:glc operon protein GlcG
MHFDSTTKTLFFQSRKIATRPCSGNSAQTAASERCYPFLAMRTLHTLDYSEARRAADVILEKAAQMQKAAVVAVADAHGDLIFLARMDGAPISSIRVAANKAYTAARERKPSKEIGDKVKHPEKGHDISYFGDPNYTGWGGGLPVVRNGEVIGALAVSGLSSAEDIALATVGVELLTRN